MPDLHPAIPPDSTPPEAYFGGVRAGLALPALILAATFLGIGSLARDLGFPLLWTLIGTLLIWAGPSHLILVSGIAAGTPMSAVALSICLTSVRLFPMVMSIMPLLRAGRPGRLALFLSAHSVAISMWVEGLRLLPPIRAELRAPFYLGLATTLIGTAAVATIAGHQLAAGLPPAFGAGLLFLTPIFFLLSLVRNSRDLPDRLAVMIGIGGVLALAPFGGGFDLFWAGLGGGTLAYGLGRLPPSRPRAAGDSDVA